MIDLHTHSNISDGIYSPSQLIKKAKENNIEVLALTDHDTIEGLEEAKKTADTCNITFVPGIEISIEWPTGEFHLLGLGLKTISRELNEVVDFLKTDRENRNFQIIQKMNDSNIPCTMDDIKKIAQNGSIGRPHFAQYLVDIKKVKNRQLAFDKYLAKGRPFYVKHNGANLDVAINAIKSSGGTPVIAHPLSLYLSWGKIQNTLEDLFSRGIEGLEAWHSGIRVVEAQRLEVIAKKIGFFVTAGSDFHGETIRRDRKLGHTAGGFAIDNRFWTEELSKFI